MLEELTSRVFTPLLVFSVLTAGTVLFFRYGYLIILHPKKTLAAFFGRGREKKGVSAYKSVCLALASTMGVGNIVGVSTAIAAGGPGAVFWMTFSSFIAMTVKYAEVALGVDSREYVRSRLRGGAPYYIKKYFSKTAGKIFAVLLLFNCLTVGDLLQVNAAAEGLDASFGLDRGLTGILFCLTAAVALTRKKAVFENVASVSLPVATALFGIFSIYAVASNASGLGNAFGLIFKNAFAFRPAVAGGAGYGMAKAIRYGVSRGIMSNEAGSGTSPTAHSITEKSPAEQGIFGIFEVFADTVVTCNLTALVILLAFGENCRGMTGMELALSAFAKFFGIKAGAIIALSVSLFAFATLTSQFFYGREAMFFITGSGLAKKLFDLAFLACAYLGCVIPFGLLWSLTDLNVCVMTSANCLFLLFSGERVKDLTFAYYGKKRRKEK